VPEQVELFRQRFPLFKVAGETQTEFDLRCSDGSVVTMTFNGRIGRDSHGAFQRTHCILTDVTEQRRLEDERGLLLGAIERSLNEIYLFDADSLRFEFVNLGARANLGHSLEDLRSMTPLDLKPEFSEESYRATLIDGERVLLSVIRDITERRRAEAALMETTTRLRLTVQAAVAALGAAAELRDPYTAGHQRRVAELACAIAGELGWEEERVEMLRTAALLHDIGKMVVPTEILARPGRLSEPEMLLIRQHADAGVGIVADIDFGGAIVEAIGQHHERLDGSGYPNGLRGDQMLLEARVLAVADVVEAMSSHRPYRPALPPEAAFEELESGAGSLYDRNVCTACLRLLREKGFTLSD